MKRRSEKGAVALFIVIFTALIVTVVTVSFTQLMIANQQQATNNDLSQRAYDSAIAGVEDAKRLLVLDAKCDQTPGPNCHTYNAAISAKKCSTVQDAGLGTTTGGQNNETQVGIPNDNQGYTCVIITQDTPSYVGPSAASGSIVIPLRGVSPFNTIRVSWFSQANLNGSSLTFPTTNSSQLPPASSWTSTTPPILRTQFIPGDTPVGSQLDTSPDETAFLYPSSLPRLSPQFQPRAAAAAAQATSCTQTLLSNTGYACQATLALPHGATTSAFLQLAPIYNVTSFKVELLTGGDRVVDFRNVQPTVDSTGRASNVFRRVFAHVTVNNGIALPYPDATLNVGNNLCKTFFVTTSPGDYNAGSCNP